MVQVMLYSSIVLSLAVVAVGVYLTMYAYSNKDKLTQLPTKVTDNVSTIKFILNNVKTLKWMGPALIGVGALLFLAHLWCAVKGCHYPGHHDSHPDVASSNFGFKFY